MAVNVFCGVSTPPVEEYTENMANNITGSEKEKLPRLKALMTDPFKIKAASVLEIINRNLYLKQVNNY